MAIAKKPVKSADVVKIRPIQQAYVDVTIQGKSPLIMHKWSEKAKQMMRDKHAGKKTKNRDARDPEQECEDATHYLADGKTVGIPAGALKAAIINAAHKDLGIEKTLVRKAIFVVCDDPSNCLPLNYDRIEMVEDVVRVGMGSTDLRYRPYIYDWSFTATFEVDAELITQNDLLNLIDRAGFGVGLLETRPEKGGENGRFTVTSIAVAEREAA